MGERSVQSGLLNKLKGGTYGRASKTKTFVYDPF